MQNLPLHVYTAFPDADKPDILLRGFQKYLRTNYKTSYVSCRKIYNKEGTTLSYYPAKEEATNALFIVPSLINGPEIFDLNRECSFIRYMTEHGIDVYLVDWGDLSTHFEGGLKDLLEKKMRKLWGVAGRHCNVPLHAMGYCLGGTLCATFFTRQNIDQLPASLTFLAAPLDFRIEGASWDYIRKYRQAIEGQILLQGVMSRRMMQSFFIQLEPELVFKKFQKFLEMPPGSKEEKRFVAVENWLNGGADIPQKLAMDLIETYFAGDHSFDVDQDLQEVKIAYISSEKDHITPPESANAAKDIFPYAQHIKNESGHVGMMIGKAAKEAVWEPLLNFLTGFVDLQKQFRAAAK